MPASSPVWPIFGCLFGLLGSLAGATAGVMAGVWHFDRYADAIREADPDAIICGLPELGAMIVGGISGGLGGAIAGMVVAYLISRKHPRDGPSPTRTN